MYGREEFYVDDDPYGQYGQHGGQVGPWYQPPQPAYNGGGSVMAGGGYPPMPYGPYGPPRRDRISPWCCFCVIGLFIIVALAIILPVTLIYLPNQSNTVTLEAELNITNLDYDDELRDPTSQLFQAYQRIICGEVTDAIVTADIEKVKCEVTQFSKGSVIANIRLTLPSIDNVEDDDLKKTTAMEIFDRIGGKTLEYGEKIFQDGNFCLGNPCGANSQCKRVPYNFKCTCNPGYKKETPLTCVEDLPSCAEDAPCMNGATCSDDATKGFTCTCADGFDGDTCANDIRACNNDPCMNGGACTDVTGGGFTCVCVTGFQGDTCMDDVRACDATPCANGGTCADVAGGGYSCTCAEGFSGDTCTTDMRGCNAAPCENGGTCTDVTGGYTCACVPGYTGATCGTNIDECATSPCMNGGTCTDEVNGYTCACAEGYGIEGTDCDTFSNYLGCWAIEGNAFTGPVKIDGEGKKQCITLCAAEGTKYATFTNSICKCAVDGEDYKANDVSIACSSQCIDTVGNCGGPTSTDVYLTILQCSNNVCKNGATCTDDQTGVNCTCAPGFSGDECETQDFCMNNPCQNGGTCTSNTDDYDCACSEGWADKDCTLAYAGCFVKDSPLLDYHLGHGTSAEDCIAKCVGFAYATILEPDCFCKADLTGLNKVETSFCNTPCTATGKSDQTCGGTDRLSVYPTA